jgi:hypothetical protein
MGVFGIAARGAGIARTRGGAVRRGGDGGVLFSFAGYRCCSVQTCELGSFE